MMSVAKAAKWLACLSLLLPLPIQAYGQVLAGAAKTLITPSLNGSRVYLAGFGHNRIASAVHDPLYVRCASLKIAKTSVVLCAADLIGLFYEDVQKIRRKFRAQSGSDALLIVACTHVHEGPDTLGLWGPSPLESGVDAAYLESVEDRISETAVAAFRNMEPGRMRLARDEHPLLAELQSVDRPPYVKDPLLHILQLQRRSNGEAIATLVFWTDHPETLNRKNTEITADFPGWICRNLEQRYGGTALMFNGAAGKVSTLGAQVALLDPVTGQVAEDGGWRKPELLGTLIGQLAEQALATGEPANPNMLTIRSSAFFLPLANDRFRIAHAAHVFGERRPLFTEGKPDNSVAEREIDHQTVRLATGKDLQSEVDYVELRTGSRILVQLVTIPGEIFPELVNGGITRYPGADYPDAPMEIAVRSLLKSKYQLIIGLGNDEMGYIIPKAEWDEQPPWLNNSPRAYYGEINSPGPETAPVIAQALAELIAGTVKPNVK
jgi:hypothetical protein